MQMDLAKPIHSFKKFEANNINTAKHRCIQYRRRILEISQTVTALHVAPAFSCLEMTDVIYHSLMRRVESNESKDSSIAPNSTSTAQFHDTFLMSKGHGCLSQYVILEDLGILTRNDLALYCRPEGMLGAHPDYGTPGIAASTGSLGHGMGIATGMAYADKLMNSDRITYLLLSDGEFQEGSTWEALMMAANLNLNNIVAFLDLNDLGGLARMTEGHPAFYPVVEKLEAFNWEAVTVDGHNAQQIHDAVMNRAGDRPFLVVCNTVKGKGVSYMEEVPIWHYRSPNKMEYEQALTELSNLERRLSQPEKMVCA